MRYNLQPVHNELCVQWNSIFFQAVSATCFGPTLSLKVSSKHTLLIDQIGLAEK